MKAKMKLLNSSPNQLQKFCPVAIISEDGFPFIAARGDMIVRPGYSIRSGRAMTIAPIKLKFKNQ
jgi:hypothetical protein